jgi:uncharacterized membrane protein
LDVEQELKLEPVNRAIKRAWITGIVLGSLQAISVIINHVFFDLPLYPWYFADTAIFFLLSIGVFAKSRLAGVVMLIYVLLTILKRINEVQEGQSVSGIGVFIYLIVGWFAFQGVCGLLAYHKVTKAAVQSDQQQETEELLRMLAELKRREALSPEDKAVKEEGE